MNELELLERNVSIISVLNFKKLIFVIEYTLGLQLIRQ